MSSYYPLWDLIAVQMNGCQRPIYNMHWKCYWYANWLIVGNSYPVGFFQLLVDSYWTGACEGLMVYPLGRFLVDPSLAMDAVCTYGPLLATCLMLHRPDALRSGGVLCSNYSFEINY